MITPIRLDTFKKLGFNAGILLKNFDYAAATDAPSLAALIASAITDGTGLMGATKGGLTVQSALETWTPELDGMRTPFRGSRQTSSWDIKITGTLVELTGENFKDIFGAADMVTEGKISTVTVRDSIQDSDYIDKLVWIGDKGSDGLCLAEISNALNTTGLNMTLTDKDVATLPFEFTAHSDNPNATTMPITIKLFA